MFFLVNRPCPYDGDFKCNDGRCLRSYSVCDGYPHCQSEEDEQNCGNLNETMIHVCMILNNY